MMKTAMILAAGRGERLKPLTDTIPKALCEINNIPLIEYHVTKLAQAGFEHLVINHAYLGWKIRDYLGNGARFGITIDYSPEPTGGLETGGGIFNALALLGREPFLCVNADIFTDYDFAAFKLPENSLGHLVLVPKPKDYPNADFGLSSTAFVLNQNKEYTFSGIAGYRPEMFKQCQVGRYSITPMLRQLATNQRISGELYTGSWFDIGSLERLQLAQNVARK